MAGKVATFEGKHNLFDLWRNGDLDHDVDYIQIDNLTYSYHAVEKNKLLGVKDHTSHPGGFKDGTNTDEDFAYDGFGNMTSDKNKGIDEIAYNHLNLPVSIEFASGGRINYIYDANGRKLRKTVQTTAGISTLTEYDGAFQYTNGVLDFIQTAEGYVKTTFRQTTPVFNYVFNYKDHLGNVRLSFFGKAQSPRIIEENHYYPFGLKHEKYNSDTYEFVELEGSEGYYTGIELAEPNVRNSYQHKYNGKEFQDELGLNMTAMDYRQYDNALGRFNSIDALAEMQYSNTPYHFGYNNPAYWADPTGLLSIDFINNIWNRSEDDTQTTWTNQGGMFMHQNNTGMIDGDTGEYTALVGLPQVDITVDRRNWSGAGAVAQMHVYQKSSFYDSFWSDMRSGQMDSFQNDLNYAGTVPGLGEIADGLNAIISVFRGDYTGAGLSVAAMVPFAGTMVTATRIGYRPTSKMVRSALSDRVGKRGFTEVGYQFQKHAGRGNSAWNAAIPVGAVKNPATFNNAGYETFKEILRSPGSIQNVGGFLEKRLPDGRGIRFQENFKFKGFLD